MSEWLQAINLQDSLSALQDLGAARVIDLLELEDEDMASLKLKVLEARRLKNALQALRLGSTDIPATSSAGVPGAMSAAPAAVAAASAAAPAASADAAAQVHAATAEPPAASGPSTLVTALAAEPSDISGAAAAAAAPAPGAGGDTVGTEHVVATVLTAALRPTHAAEPSESTSASTAGSELTPALVDRRTGDGAQGSHA